MNNSSGRKRIKWKTVWECIGSIIVGLLCWWVLVYIYRAYYNGVEFLFWVGLVGTGVGLCWGYTVVTSREYIELPHYRRKVNQRWFFLVGVYPNLVLCILGCSILVIDEWVIKTNGELTHRVNKVLRMLVIPYVMFGVALGIGGIIGHLLLAIRGVNIWGKPK